MLQDNNDLQAHPVETYTPPNIPTLDDAQDTQLLKTLPSRWKKNTAVLACLGFAGVLGLAGYTALHNRRPNMPYYLVQEYPYDAAMANIQAAELELRVHWGGFGSGPFYVVHITENEVLAFVRARLEAAGLVFSDPAADTFWSEHDGSQGPFLLPCTDIGLYDALNNVAVIRIIRIDPFRIFNREWHEPTKDAFSTTFADTTFGMYYNPTAIIGRARYSWRQTRSPNFRPRHNYARDRAMERERPALIENLSAQIDEFIAQLKAEGIID